MSLFRTPDPEGPLQLTLEHGPRILGIPPGEPRTDNVWIYTLFWWIARSVHIDPHVLWHECNFKLLGHGFVPKGDNRSRWHDAMWWSEGMTEPQFGGNPNFSKDVVVPMSFGIDICRFLDFGVTEISSVEHDPEKDHQMKSGWEKWQGCPLKPMDVRTYVSEEDDRQHTRCFVGFQRTGGQVIIKNGELIRAFDPGRRVDWKRDIEVVGA